MIKAVLDTNILASGTISSFNPPGKILDAWRAGQFVLVTSEHILGELEHAFKKPYFQKHADVNKVNAFMELLRDKTFIVPITIHIKGIATHPEDDLVLATAVSAKVDYLVTGDGPFLRKVGSIYQNVNLVTPSDFLKVLQQ